MMIRTFRLIAIFKCQSANSPHKKCNQIQTTLNLNLLQNPCFCVLVYLCGSDLFLYMFIIFVFIFVHHVSIIGLYVFGMIKHYAKMINTT